MSLGTPETSQNNEEKGATIELHVQGFYKLYVELFKGVPPLTTEKGFIMSPKFRYKLKVPFFFLTNYNAHFCALFVSQKLAKLPISLGLATYIEPHIVQNVISLGKRSLDKEFKVVFDVKVVEIDLADNRECDGFRKRGLI